MNKNLEILIKSLNNNHYFVEDFCKSHSNLFERMVKEKEVLVYDLLLKVIGRSLKIIESEKSLKPKTVYETKYWVYMDYPLVNGRCYSNGKEYIDSGSCPIVIITDEKGETHLAIGHRHNHRHGMTISTWFEDYTKDEFFSKNDINEEFLFLLDIEKYNFLKKIREYKLREKIKKQ